MAFIKDTLDKIILGRTRFLNLRPIKSEETQLLVIDENGYLGTGDPKPAPAPDVNWDSIEGKPSEFPPSPHEHNDADGNKSGFMSSFDKIKLDDIQVGATKNDTDDNLKNRQNHRGVQDISTIEGLQGELDSKLYTADFLQELEDIPGYEEGAVLTATADGIRWVVPSE